MNIFPRFSLFCLLFFWMVLACADSGYSGIVIAPNDYSMQFLGYIFGQVGNVIPGQGNSLLGLMFKQFNYGITVLAILIFGYIYGKGIIDTAADGQFLGKKANSVWVPLRGVLGLLLLVPSSYSGYNIAQVGSMWVLTQGIGIADQVWSTAATYLESNRATTIGAANDIYKNSAMANYEGVVKNIFQYLVCQAAAAQKWPNGQIDNFEVTRSVDGTEANKVVTGYSINYQEIDATTGVTTTHHCGTIDWTNIVYNTVTSGTGKIPQISGANTSNVNSDDTTGEGLRAVYQSVIYDIINTFTPIASYYVTSSWDPNVAVSAMVFPVSLDGKGADVYSYAGSNFVYEATQMFMGQIAFYKQEPLQNATDSINDYLSKGWILAGAYWYNFKNKNGSGSPYLSAVATASTGTDFTSDSAISNPFNASGSYADKVYQSYSDATNDADAQDLAAIIGVGGTVLGIAGITAIIMAVGAEAPPLAAAALVATTVIIGGAATMAGIANNDADPVYLLTVLGDIMLASAGVLWLAVLVITFFTSISTNIMNCVSSVGQAYNNSMFYVFGLIFTMVAALFSGGFLLTIYLPMLPYFYFTLGAIHYFMIVLELMIIIVIGVLGLMMPEGQHDLWGMAQQAVFFLISAFLRPVMMIFGLIAAGLIVNVAIRIINAGFYTVLIDMTGGYALLNPVESILYIFVYGGLCIVACSIPFRLINRVPDAAMQGINFAGSRVDVENDLGMAKKGSEGTAKGMGQATGQFSRTATKDLASGKETTAGSNDPGKNSPAGKQPPTTT